MKIPWNKKYLSIGITAFLVIAASILFFLFLNKIDIVISGVRLILDILMPVIFGFAIAYLLNPVLNFFEHTCFDPLIKRANFKKPKPRLARVLGIVVTMLLSLLAVAGLLWLVIPQLAVSISGIVGNLPGYYNKSKDWIIHLFESNPDINQFVESQLESILKYVDQVVQKLIPALNDMVGGLTAGVIGVAVGVKNVLIGWIISIYILMSKEKFSAQAKKILVAIFPIPFTKRFIRTMHETDRVFGGFISGKLLDSLIVGVLCFLGCSIFRMPYAVLVSVLIGVSNIIPFFGPFIGAIPSALIILLIDPVKALIFVIFIIILQQLDGNVIGPKILGESTGLSAFWVIFAILLGGGLFGFVGMFIGCPAFAVIYSLIRTFINGRLEKKGVPVETAYYQTRDSVEELKASEGDPIEETSVGKPS